MEGHWSPAMDLLENEDGIVLRADLPGMSEGDVNIEIRDGVLTISGERRADHEEKGEGFHRVERAFGNRSGHRAPRRRGCGPAGPAPAGPVGTYLGILS